jgi:hypothetical protein
VLESVVNESNENAFARQVTMPFYRAKDMVYNA